MEIINPRSPLVVELSDEDITLMHLAFYEYRDYLKKNRALRKDKKRWRMKKLGKLIVLVDLLM
ncbi:hypothetical protein K8S19_05920 [bacterium]|nr:hypothetical protein [bacterium]